MVAGADGFSAAAPAKAAALALYCLGRTSSGSPSSDAGLRAVGGAIALSFLSGSGDDVVGTDARFRSVTPRDARHASASRCEHFNAAANAATSAARSAATVGFATTFVQTGTSGMATTSPTFSGADVSAFRVGPDTFRDPAAARGRPLRTASPSSVSPSLTGTLTSRRTRTHGAARTTESPLGVLFGAGSYGGRSPAHISARYSSALRLGGIVNSVRSADRARTASIAFAHRESARRRYAGGDGGGVSAAAAMVTVAIETTTTRGVSLGIDG